FTFAWGANPGADVPVSEDNISGARNFCNKLWNATRFALLNGATTEGELPQRLSGADAWIISRLNRVIAEVDGYYADYEFAKIADLLYHFAWDEVCDWYLELAKVSLAEESSAAGTRRVLGEVLDGLLRLLHPLTPFVTESLWTALTGGESIVIAAWPQSQESRLDKAAEDDVLLLQARVVQIRQFLSAQGVKPAQRIPAWFAGLSGYEPQIRRLLRLGEPAEDFTATATLELSDGATVELDLSTAVDVAAERARLARVRATAGKELEQTGKKLANDAFLANAKPEVVASIRARNGAAAADLQRIDEALSRLPQS
ncbi:MAG: class I tRNA ligase family protein, partial [Jatrophihabitantaceae bacterium]